MPEAYVEKTQNELGAVIATPKLTEKLLMKPPFRFLHDIVTSFLSATAFPQGLYSEDLLDSTKTTEKPKKIEFLTLLIAAVEAATGTKVAAQPSKIVAGQEADKTNELLQLLAACAKLTPGQKAAAVQKARSAVGGDVPLETPAAVADNTDKAVEKEKERKDEERRRRKEEERRRRKEEEAAAEMKAREQEEGQVSSKRHEGSERKQKSGDSHASKRENDESRRKYRDSAEEEERRRRHEEKRRHEREREATEQEEALGVDENTPFSSPVGVRSEKRSAAAVPSHVTATTTAGKAPPRTRSARPSVTDFQAAGATAGVGVVHESGRMPGKTATTEEDDNDDWMRVAEQQEARPVMGSSSPDGAGDGAQDMEARGYLGQQALRAKREQEEEAARRAQEAEARAQQGRDGIIIHSSKSGRSGAAMVEGELSKLRERLQLLTKASNPLGKLLESIYDDIDAMARELEMWRSEARTQALAAADAKRQTRESLQEVHAQLQNLEDAINDQILKTHNIRCNVINNDNAIAGMVRMIVNPDIGKR